jgi:hypothetical protein
MNFPQGTLMKSSIDMYGLMVRETQKALLILPMEVPMVVRTTTTTMKKTIIELAME